MSDNATIADVILSSDFLILCIIGALAGVARCAIDNTINNVTLVVRRAYLGAFWSTLVYLVSNAAERQDIDLLPNWVLVVIAIIGAIYATEAIDIVRKQLHKRIGTNGKK